MSNPVKALWDKLWFVNMGYTNKIWLIDWLMIESYHRFVLISRFFWIGPILTWKRCFLAPTVTLAFCHAPSAAPVFPANSHTSGWEPSKLSITLTDSTPAAETSYQSRIEGSESCVRGKMEEARRKTPAVPMWSGFPVNAKSKLREQAGPEGPSRGVRVWASVSCWPGAWATNRYSSRKCNDRIRDFLKHLKWNEQLRRVM